MFFSQILFGLAVMPFWLGLKLIIDFLYLYHRPILRNGIIKRTRKRACPLVQIIPILDTELPSDSASFLKMMLSHMVMCSSFGKIGVLFTSTGEAFDKFYISVEFGKAYIATFRLRPSIDSKTPVERAREIEPIMHKIVSRHKGSRIDTQFQKKLDMLDLECQNLLKHTRNSWLGAA